MRDDAGDSGGGGWGRMRPCRGGWPSVVLGACLVVALLAPAAAAQVVTSISPDSGPPGTQVTLSGSGLGTACGPHGATAACSVSFYGPTAQAEATVISWSDAAVVVTVPDLPPGVYHPMVYTAAGAAVGPGDSPVLPPFTVTAAGAAPGPAPGTTTGAPFSLSPSSGPHGTQVVFQGQGFGSAPGAVLFTPEQAGSPAVAAVVDAWSDTRVVATVPDGLPYGPALPSVVPAGGQAVGPSGGWPAFDVTAGPSPLPAPALAPSSGSPGTPFVVTGAAFGVVPGAVQFCQFCGTPAQVLLPATVTGWTDTAISGAVPGGLQPGGAEVLVTTAAGTQELKGNFTVEEGPDACLDAVLTVGQTTAQIGRRTVAMPVAPVIRGGRTFVPLRFVAEATGGAVSWDGATRQVTVVVGGMTPNAATTVAMTEGDTAYTVDGQMRQMDAAPWIEAPGYTMVPIRFVAQALGEQVVWVPATQEVVLDPCAVG
jgi:hypothetical protein